MAAQIPENPPNPNLETGEVQLFTPEVASCPQAVYRDLARSCPVGRAAMLGTPILSRYEDVKWALAHPEIFSSAMEEQMDLGTERPMIPQQIDPPAQVRYRKLLDPLFSRKRMKAFEPKVRERASRLIDGFIADGECEYDHAFAVPLPCSAFLDVMGLPQADLGLFLELKDSIIRPWTKLTPEEREVTGPEGMKLLQAATHRIKHTAGQQIYAYFEETLVGREREPQEDLLGFLVQAEKDGERLTRTEQLDICFLLIIAGLDTVTATLGCNMVYLASNPEQRRRLVGDASLLDGAIEELLRWETPVTGVPRLMVEDVTLHGVKLEAGQMVSLLLGASNVDEREFEDPERVDFARPHNRHIAFGAGPHRCLGSHLARMELRVAIEEWHRRIPEYRIKPGEVPTYSPGIREVMYLPLEWDRA
jgi:cytochrome P450